MIFIINFAQTNQCTPTNHADYTRTVAEYGLGTWPCTCRSESNHYPPSQDSAPDPSHAEQLAPLQFAAAMAEATARETAALEAAAISRRNIQSLDIETQHLARRSTSVGSVRALALLLLSSCSPPSHRQRSPRDGSPPEIRPPPRERERERESRSSWPGHASSPGCQ